MLKCKGCRKSFETLPIHKYKVCSAACLKKVTAKPETCSMRTVKQRGKYNPIFVKQKIEPIKKKRLKTLVYDPNSSF